MLCMYYAESTAYLTGEFSAIHDCSVADMPQIKKWVRGGWGTMFNQNWEKKEKCGIENKT